MLLGMAIDSLDELRTFVAIVEAGNLTAAAQRLGLTVNATSRRLQQLERGVGARVIERTTRRCAPTEAGRRLYARATPILDALLEAESAVRTAGAEVEGRVTVALPPLVAGRPFLADLANLLSKHTALRVDLRIGSSQLPGEGDVDLAVLVGDVPQSFALVARRLGTHRWCLAAAPAYLAARQAPRTPADLAAHVCLRYRGDVTQKTWSLTGPRGKRASVNVEGSFECDDSRVLGEATYAGLGIGVRPQSELEDAVRQGQLVHVLPEWRFSQLPTHLVTTTGRRALRRVVLVSEVVAQAVRGLG